MDFIFRLAINCYCKRGRTRNVKWVLCHNLRAFAFHMNPSICKCKRSFTYSDFALLKCATFSWFYYFSVCLVLL